MLLLLAFFFFFFFNDTATTEIYTLSLHDALPIFDHLSVTHDRLADLGAQVVDALAKEGHLLAYGIGIHLRSEEHTSELQSPDHLVCRLLLEKKKKTNKYNTGSTGHETKQ